MNFQAIPCLAAVKLPLGRELIQKDHDLSPLPCFYDNEFCLQGAMHSTEGGTEKQLAGFGSDASVEQEKIQDAHAPRSTTVGNNKQRRDEEIISGGSTGLVYRISSGYVRKTFYSDDTRKQSIRDLEVEHKIYQRLPRHDRLIQMVDYSEEHGLILEYMPNGNLREYLQEKNTDIDLKQRLQWACDAAEGLQLLHSHNIIHCDMKPENLLLDSELRVRVIDFSGSCMDGAFFSALEGARFFLPRSWKSQSTVTTDLFALGSTIYEIITGTQPFAEHTDEEVEDFFRNGVFPDLDHVHCGAVIKKCWYSEIHSAEEIYQFINSEIRGLSGSFLSLHPIRPLNPCS